MRQIGWLKFIALLGVMAASGCTTATPGTSYRYYPVAATDLSGLARSVRASAPHGGRAYGLTEITFVPSFALKESDGFCRAEKVKVDLALLITLPKWRENVTLSGSAGSHFRRFERTITAHEHHHVAIARSYANRAAKRIQKMTTKAGCAKLRTDVAAYMAQMKKAHLAAHAAYDRRERRRLTALLPRS